MHRVRGQTTEEERQALTFSQTFESLLHPEYFGMTSDIPGVCFAKVFPEALWGHFSVLRGVGWHEWVVATCWFYVLGY